MRRVVKVQVRTTESLSHREATPLCHIIRLPSREAATLSHVTVLVGFGRLCNYRRGDDGRPAYGVAPVVVSATAAAAAPALVVLAERFCEAAYTNNTCYAACPV